MIVCIFDNANIELFINSMACSPILDKRYSNFTLNALLLI